MNILLDTHVFLWWTLDDERLPRRWRETLEAAENTVYLSAATAWEIVIKQGIGRLKVADDPSAWYRKYVDHYRLAALPITHEHALAVFKLPVKHNDPFDRVLIAQAICEGLTLATVDEAIRQYEVPVLT
jgi:PIN domain nuclease of toxin-antitoxin system